MKLTNKQKTQVAVHIMISIYNCQLGNYHTIVIFLLKNLNIFSVQGLNLIDTNCKYKDENAH